MLFRSAKGLCVCACLSVCVSVCLCLSDCLSVSLVLPSVPVSSTIFWCLSGVSFVGRAMLVCVFGGFVEVCVLIVSYFVCFRGV